MINESIDAKTQCVQTDLNKKLKPRRKTISILKSISPIVGLKSTYFENFLYGHFVLVFFYCSE